MGELGEILVEAKDVSKKFSRNLRRSLIYGLKDVLRSVTGIKRSPELQKDEFWAVKNISFQLRRGECLGLIGHNGAGKSTLLKMLNGLIKPDEGEIVMRGRISALIELGAGFNPVLTGRENIYVNGQILGLTKKEIDNKLEAIIDFSEIRDFIDSPVQNYSSGMKVRLGFAVAAQMEPDVLIVDEVLAVGDMGFKLKCFDVMDSMMKNTAIIFVSHSMPMVSRICSQIILMENGVEKIATANVSEAIDLYYSRFGNSSSKVTYQADEQTELLGMEIFDTKPNEHNLKIVEWLSDLKIKIRFKVANEIDQPTLTLYFLDKEQRPVGICINEEIAKDSKVERTPTFTVYETIVIFERIQFSMGTYFITFGLSKENNKNPLLRVRNAVSFQVTSKKHVWQTLQLDAKWQISN